MQRDFYTIRVIDNLILVRNVGHWTLAQNIAYLSELSDTLIANRNRLFTIFVDMREWSVDEPTKTTSIKRNLKLDRRNQKAEHWLCKDLSASDHLLPYFEKEQFPLERHLDKDKAWEALSHALNNKNSLSALEEWFNLPD